MGLMQVTANAGTYSFVSTRNNNFSNRSQKMSISVGAGMALSAGQVAGAVVGTVVGVAAAVVIAVVVLALFGIVKASWLPKQKFGQGAAGGKGVKASQQYDVSQSNNGTTRV